jgi:hypothetical protein
MCYGQNANKMNDNLEYLKDLVYTLENKIEDLIARIETIEQEKRDKIEARLFSNKIFKKLITDEIFLASAGNHFFIYTELIPTSNKKYKISKKMYNKLFSLFEFLNLSKETR